jgi:hypothetical protein
MLKTLFSVANLGECDEAPRGPRDVAPARIIAVGRIEGDHARLRLVWENTSGRASTEEPLCPVPTLDHR